MGRKEKRLAQTRRLKEQRWLKQKKKGARLLIGMVCTGLLFSNVAIPASNVYANVITHTQAEPSGEDITPTETDESGERNTSTEDTGVPTGESAIEQQLSLPTEKEQAVVGNAKVASPSDRVANPTITYSANGGSNVGAILNDQIAAGASYTVRSIGKSAGELDFVAPNAASQLFEGWNTAADGTGTSYTAGATIASWPYSMDTILYAQWAKASVLSFNANGTTGETMPSSQFDKVGTAITVPAIPAGLTSTLPNTTVGTVWNTRADGAGVDYAPNSTFTLTETNTVLYVKVIPNVADINAQLTFDLNGGDPSSDPSITSGIKTDVADDFHVTLPTTIPTRPGYKFLAWRINNVNYQPGARVSVKYSATAVAQWTAQTEITWNSGVPGGSTDVVTGIPANNIVASNNALFTIPATVPTRESTDGKIYTFMYWKLNDQTTIFPGGQWRVGNNVPIALNFVAQWHVLDPVTDYVVAFNGNGNTSGAPENAYVNVEKGKAITIPGKGTLARTNFAFVGWSDKEDEDTIYREGDSFTPTKDGITLHAVWAPVSTAGTISFDTQAKSGSNPATIAGDAGDRITLPDAPSDNVEPQEDYKFWGWATAKNSTIPDFYAGKSYTLSKGNTTLYGVWSPVASGFWAQIKINNGGATGVLPAEYKSNNVYELTAETGTHAFTVPPIDTLSHPGYIFEGWQYSKDGKTYQPGATITLSNISVTKDPGTLTAQWKPITYTITYSAGDATGGMVPTNIPQIVDYGASYTVEPNTNLLVKEGSTFIGWTDGQTIYTPGQNISPGADVVLTPAWKVNPVPGGGGGGVPQAIIMYVALEPGVTGTLPESVSVRSDFTTSYTVAEPNPGFSYPGHTFVGWYILNAKGLPIDYSPGSTFVVHEDMIFYAKWKPTSVQPEGTFALSFNGNGNTSGLVPNEQYVKEGSSIALPTHNTLEKKEYIDNNETTGEIEYEDYIFVGWSINKNASPNDEDVYPAGTLVKPEADTVYYAIWDKKERDVTLRYDGNGNTGGMVPDGVTVPRYTEEMVDPKNEGSTLTKVVMDISGPVTYIFAGWNTEADGSGLDYYSGKLMSVAADTILYAKWVPTTAVDGTRIIYVGNGNTAGDFIRYEDTKAETYIIKAPGNMVRAGYLFTGWNTEGDGSGKSYNVSEVFATKDRTSLILYAQWQPVDAANIYVVYNGNGNTAGTVPETITTQKNVPVTLASTTDVAALGLVKTGYSFAGWSGNIAGTGVMYVPGAEYPFAVNTILYAIWAEYNYIATPAKITYNPNYAGSTGNYIVEGAVDEEAEVNGTTILYGHKVVADEKNGGAYFKEDSIVASYAKTGLPVRPYSTFLGWSTDPEATTADYSPEQVVNMSTTMLDLYAVWAPATYTINYDSNSGTGMMDPQVVDYEAEIPLSTNTFTKTGYTFTGWNTQKDGSGTAYTDKEQVKNLAPVDESITLYAQWSANDHLIQFNANGGMTEQPTLTGKTDEVVDLSGVGEATRAGYTFEGWYTEATGGVKMPTNLTMPNGDVTYYAQWKANDYIVSFNGNNGQGTMADQGFTYDVAQTLTKNSYTREGYQFMGWNTQANGTGAFYDDQESVMNLVTEVNGKVTLYAQWLAANDNPIMFDANGGTTNQPTLVKATDEVVDLKTVLGATRTGYTFEGWYTEKTAGEKMPDSLTVPAGGVTYYAQWKANDYIVSFNGNNGQGTMADQGFTYDVSQALTKNSYTREGYQFGGWNTQANGSGTSYDDQESVMNLVMEANGKVTLYAQWLAANDNPIKFDANGGTTNQPTLVKATDEVVDLKTVLGATRTGYTFEGWYTEKTAGEKMPDSLTVPAGGVTYYAQWKANNYVVSFNGNSGQGTMTDQSFTYNVAQGLTKNSYTREGYQFMGWNTQAKGTGASYDDQESVTNLVTEANGTITLYAQWLAANDNPIRFDANGGTTDQPTLVKATDEVVDLTTVLGATRTGYTFEGWYTEKTAGDKMPNSLTVPAGGVTYYAQWTANNYVVSFNGNKGQGTMTDQTFTYDVSQALTKNSYTREGYQFVGWTTQATGDGATYDDQESVTNLVTETNGIITLYAQWKANAYLISFDANQGEGAMADQPFIYDVPQAIKANKFTRTGYTFMGWSTNENGTRRLFSDEEVVENLTTDNGVKVILYAQWQANDYRISYDANAPKPEADVHGVMPDQSFMYDEPQALTQNTYELLGYRFTGWNTTALGSGDSYQDEAVVTNLTAEAGGQVVLYAQWEAEENEITFDTMGGTTTQQTITSPTDTLVDLSQVAQATRDGYTFDGWYTEKVGGEKMPTSVEMPAGGVTYYAQWTPIPEVVEPETPTKPTIPEVPTTPTMPTSPAKVVAMNETTRTLPKAGEVQTMVMILWGMVLIMSVLALFYISIKK